METVLKIIGIILLIYIVLSSIGGGDNANGTPHTNVMNYRNTSASIELPEYFSILNY